MAVVSHVCPACAKHGEVCPMQGIGVDDKDKECSAFHAFLYFQAARS